ncbi:DUF6090 family protein [Formosa sp. Hel1_31_208]|uniref:DUF6090 family protein n=1 Tax=Formosa sp. Hel1_31_208 TaxID=1798225 RepID=UPI000B80F533|nr:DUF6090 family protein [Formosa sp. Hel1_31_208]
MEKNKTGKYIKYAIGEIVLVMIGILLALQVNNWNENRKISNIEQLLLRDLRTEIQSNIVALDKIIKSHSASLDAIITLDSVITNLRQVNRPLELGRLLGAHDYNMTYDPRTGILNSIINSGKLDYISNRELRYKLSSLNDIILDTNESADLFSEMRSQFYWPLLGQLYERQPNGRFKFNRLKIINSSEFNWWTVLAKSSRIEGLTEENGLMKTLKEILELIESETKK